MRTAGIIYISESPTREPNIEVHAHFTKDTVV
jgi:hypothetical protein